MCNGLEVCVSEKDSMELRNYRLTTVVWYGTGTALSELRCDLAIIFIDRP